MDPDVSADYESLIRDIPDFPQPGVLFRDITPLLSDPAALRAVVKDLAAPFCDEGVDQVAAIEARGYLLGAPVAVELGAGIEGIRLLGPPAGLPPQGGIVALQLDGIHPHDLAVLLDAQGVMVRAGHHCTMPLHSHLSGGGDFPVTSLRASAYVYNTLADADRLADALIFAQEALTRTMVA